MTLIWIGFTIGLAGGLHCVGMCGPLVLATSNLPFRKRWKWISYRGIYQLGRMFSYGILGILIASIGQIFALGGWQNILSISLGLLLLLAYFGPHYLRNNLRSGWGRWLNALKSRMGLLLKKQSFSSQISLGFLNGLLPCGLVYLGLATAALSVNILEGFWVMFAFGAGTLPWLLAVLVAGSVGGFAFRKHLAKATPYLALAISILLILRGFDIHVMHMPTASSSPDSITICN